MDARHSWRRKHVASGATPPEGSSSANWSYGQAQGGQGGEGTPNRYNFPSAPSRQQQQPYAPPPQRPQQPYGQERPPAPRAPYEPQAPRIQPVQPQPRPAEQQPAGGAHNPLVRPYAMTGGRTRPRYQLAIEALVHTTAQPHQLQGQLPEHQRICNLCREIKSVAEISALLSIPLGVARILVADLAEAGLVAIHQPGGDENAGGQPDVTLLERVLSGLRKL
ncbi:DUF742 domain-containing protein [Streptomyces sp. B-S-A6]|uniref:DUF742 domain-containing protein n=1 Tax=Streptomyces cavernicola TaxID=3043613 RepID=A0ABT6SMK1_9ACTN|nr:DUF742 domain-containing protein [Streptomyces sp. B-S-A6]MDI3409393.1 DUF742 domain-containing protein [Streptomyces sp. B-S-A6]